MPTVSTSRKLLTALITAEDSFAMDNAIDFNYATVDVGASGSVDNIGVAMIWNNSTTEFEPYVAQVIATVISTGGSPLKDGSVIALSVGNYQGKGFNDEDTDLGGTTPKMTVLYRGDAAVLEEGIIWNGASAGLQTAFLVQLEAQHITTTELAADAAASYLA
jgi:hypothetical protein